MMSNVQFVAVFRGKLWRLVLLPAAGDQEEGSGQGRQAVEAHWYQIVFPPLRRPSPLYCLADGGSQVQCHALSIMLQYISTRATLRCCECQCTVCCFPVPPALTLPNLLSALEGPEGGEVVELGGRGLLRGLGYSLGVTGRAEITSRCWTHLAQSTAGELWSKLSMS